MRIAKIRRLQQAGNWIATLHWTSEVIAGTDGGCPELEKDMTMINLMTTMTQLLAENRVQRPVRPAAVPFLRR